MLSLKKFDTNSDKWFKSECDQMKRIHRVYRDAMREDAFSAQSTQLAQMNASLIADIPPSSELPTMDGGASSSTKEEGEILVKQTKKGDPESYLPKDSVLRSESGEMFKPGNCPFKDYDTFVQTVAIEYWRGTFQLEQGHDRMMSEIALSMVSHICTAQASKDLRVRHGSKPLGRFWRAKREQLTPLALVMHEFKLWAMNRLRVMVITEENSHVEIGKRIKLVQGLQRKEVWGPSSNALQQGMRPIAHDKLFRLLLTMREDLMRAREYSFRGYCRRRSREKLHRMGNLLKDVFFNEARMASLLGSFDSVVSDPTAMHLQPTDLFNTLHNQSFVDYGGNWVNLCLFKLCSLTLVKSALLGDFSGEDGDEDYVRTIAEWSSKNLFCSRNSLLLMDLDTSLPDLYCRHFEQLGEDLKKIDKKRKVPQTPKEWSLKMRSKIFALPSDALLVSEAIMRYLAAMQDLVPTMFAVHELWNISGEGGDFTLYDTLRQTVVFVMGDIVKRIYTLQCAQRQLFDLFESLSSAHQEAMEQRRLKTKKAEYEPNWVANFRYVQTEFESQSKRTFLEAFKQAQEIAKDAWDYSLTKSKLDDKIAKCKNLGDALLGHHVDMNQPLKGDFSMQKVVDLKTRDWMGIVGQQEENAHGSSQAFILTQEQFKNAAASTTAKFKQEKEILDAEMDLLRTEFESRRISVLNVGSGGGGSNPFDLGGTDLTEEEYEKWAASHQHEEEDGNPFRD